MANPHLSVMRVLLCIVFCWEIFAMKTDSGRGSFTERIPITKAQVLLSIIANIFMDGNTHTTKRRQVALREIQAQGRFPKTSVLVKSNNYFGPFVAPWLTSVWNLLFSFCEFTFHSLCHCYRTGRAMSALLSPMIPGKVLIVFFWGAR